VRHACSHGGCYGKTASSAGIYVGLIRVPRSQPAASCSASATNGYGPSRHEDLRPEAPGVVSHEMAWRCEGMALGTLDAHLTRLRAHPRSAVRAPGSSSTHQSGLLLAALPLRAIAHVALAAALRLS
jgi:hypothetical protein